MSDRRVIDHDEFTGITSYYNFDPVTEDITIEEVSDVETVLEASKALMNSRSGGFKGDLRHVAHIPAVIMNQLMRDGIAQDPERLKAWLNDRDNSLFRTRPGRV